MDWFSVSRKDSSSQVTRAVPETTTQCSARWWCICSDSDSPGLHGQALDLIARALADGLVSAPGAMDPLMVAELVALLALEELGDGLDVLGAVLADHQHRVRGLDHDQVVHPNRRPPCGDGRSAGCCGRRGQRRRHPAHCPPRPDRAPPRGPTRRRHRTSRRPAASPRPEAPRRPPRSDRCSMTA